MNTEFVNKFWEFVKAANYENRNKGTNVNGERNHEYYRFMKPHNVDFPYQVELFSRNLGLLNFPVDAHITPVPTSEELSSLSAILLDDDYYHFVIEHSTLEEGVNIANVESLICLKCKAFLEMTERKANGELVDSKHITKHKKDVFRLAAMLAPSDRFTLSNKLKKDIEDFCKATMSDMPNGDFFKAAGMHGITGKQLLKQLKTSFLSND